MSAHKPQAMLHVPHHVGLLTWLLQLLVTVQPPHMTWPKTDLCMHELEVEPLHAWFYLSMGAA